ncbi:hypothetical protein [Thalassobaculum salexigens]|uniref:hypothetical protein n=1 Tax=Thalassobaculum salexigens TaxID=455360 RepID=UPI0004225E34|nr:hypothetical protein [Thalassobaculum salexigens]
MLKCLVGSSAAVLMLTAVFTGPAEARRIDEVRAKVQAVIDELGIDRSRIREVFVAPDDQGGEAPGSLSYSAWIAFSDCTGNLAMHLSGTTAVRTIYTTGDCAVPGVSKSG